MLYRALVCFWITIFAALAGFGGFLGFAPAAAKAIAVVFLLLFFVALYRELFVEVARPSAGAQPRALGE